MGAGRASEGFSEDTLPEPTVVQDERSSRGECGGVEKRDASSHIEQTQCEACREPSHVRCPWTVKSPPGRSGVAGEVTQSQISGRVGRVRSLTIFTL